MTRPPRTVPPRKRRRAPSTSSSDVPSSLLDSESPPPARRTIRPVSATRVWVGRPYLTELIQVLAECRSALQDYAEELVEDEDRGGWRVARGRDAVLSNLINRAHRYLYGSS